ncbi:MAG: psrP, partial [Elusimicrobia bacterium]
GGAGGAVNLTAAVFEGTATVKARGGPGGAIKGGGGGGGRVSVSVTQSGSACSLTYDVAGGTGASVSGGAGTVSSTDTLSAPAGFAGASPGTGTVSWSWGLVPGADSYQVFSSTGGLGQSGLLSALTSVYTTPDLLANTTHQFFVRARSCGASADSSAVELATLAQAPQALAAAFLDVGPSSVTARWAARPPSPAADSSEGYALEASTAADFTGTLLASSTPNVLLSTLTITGLYPNTTWYFRATSLNWAGSTGPYTSLGSTATLTDSIAAAQLFGVFGTSLTANWVPLPASPPDASSKTAQGYQLELSPNADFTGTLFSSRTPNVALSILTLAGLLSEATYYARVAALNWNGAPRYVSLGFTVTRDTTPPNPVANLAAQTAASSTTLALSWTAVGDNGPAGCVTGGAWRVQRSSDPLFAFSTAAWTVEVAANFCPGAAQTLTLSALLPNTTYFTRLWAVDEDGNGGTLSNGATAPTL